VSNGVGETHPRKLAAGEIDSRNDQTPLDPATGKLIDGDVAAQTHRVFDDLAAVLAAAGLSLDDAVKCNVYLTDTKDFPAMNGANESRFTAPFPARTTVAVAGLPLDARVEIELVARRR
jgi:2-iminobutanoate/2-iminopropanoate deaminase